MRKNLFLMFSIVYCSVFLAGCTYVKGARDVGIEITKTIWGSSTRALEAARIDAISESFPCSFDECFDAVLSFEREEPKFVFEDENVKKEEEEEEESGFLNFNLQSEDESDDEILGAQFFEIFLKSRRKKHIVVTGIVGNVETTEVGIFFSNNNTKSTIIEVTSLSSSAKRKLAKFMFTELHLRFP